MEKEGGDGAESSSKTDGLLDAASLFGAYWGRDGAGATGGSNNANSAAAAQAQAALFGFPGRYPPSSTLGVAANQAASLGLHPAASAAWWSMASHLAAQDYLARLQASGLNFPPLGDPYAALSALGGLNANLNSKQGKSNKAKPNDRSGRNSSTAVSMSSKEKGPSTSTATSQSNMRSSYGFPKTSSPSTHTSQSLSSLASLNSLVSGQGQGAKPAPNSKHNRKPSTPGKGVKDRDLALLRGDLMLAQAAAQGAYQAAVAAATKGKNVSPLFNNPFGMGAGSEKDRHNSLDSIAGLPHTILSDPSSVLGGVRLPPDTEIIKYTSSITGPKSTPGTTNRGRKKTISLDPPQVSVLPSSGDRATPSKRQKMDSEYSGSGSGSKSSVEVIRLGARQDQNISSPPPFNLSDYPGVSREFLQSIASQSGISLAALERQLATSAPSSGLNLSTKSNSSSTSTKENSVDLSKNSGQMQDEDAPLNLSLKPSSSSNQASDALSRLTSLSSSLNASTSSDRISRRKPGAKPRRVLPDTPIQNAVVDPPRPKSSGSEDSELSGGWGATREARPRNLGRGVSKPKKNTVASLLAQSRALGLRPALAQQLLAETDLEKLKAVLETASTDSECPSDSCPSDSDTSDASSRRTPHDTQLRLSLALGWKRSTLIKGLSRNCTIKGDVSYSPPEPHSNLKFKNMQELLVFLDQNPCPPLTRDNFSFSSRVILGNYIQPGLDANDTVTIGEAEITKRLEEARVLAALSGGRPTPPPVDRRIELARQQQAARDARRDATQRNRDQARLVREMEKSEKAEIAKREKEARNQLLMEQINKGRSQLTIQAIPTDEWKTPEIVMGPTKPNKNRTMAPISLTLIPVNGPKEPAKTINIDKSGWKDDIQYNALDKMRDFAEKASFDLPKKDYKYNFDLTIVKTDDKLKIKSDYKHPTNEDNIKMLIESYSRINEFLTGCDWSKADKTKKITDAKKIEQEYLDAKNEFMSQNLNLIPKVDAQKSVLPKIEDFVDLSKEMDLKMNKDLEYKFGKDGAVSISLQTSNRKDVSAKKRRHEEHERQKLEEQAKRQQEREFKRQQAMMVKEQERERRRQHTTLIRQLDSRRRWEERERRKHQNLMDRLLAKEKKLQTRKKEMELLWELRRPQEDSTLSDQKPLPTLNRIPGLKLPGQAMADILQVFEFMHNFGHTLGFDMESLPTLNTLQMGLLSDSCMEAEEEIMSVLTHLLVCSIEDPGIPHPGRHTTLLGQALRMGDITPSNISEVLRIYLYANSTGEVKALTGINAERERERRVADHHQTDEEMQVTCTSSKNQAYYEHLHNNPTYRLSEALRDKPFLALNSTTKARILAFLCDELLQNKSVLRQIDASLEHLNQLRKDRYLMDMKIRKVRVLHQRKVRAEQSEKQQALALERMQRLVEESTANLGHTPPHRSEDDATMAPPSSTEKIENSKNAQSKESSPCKEGEIDKDRDASETEREYKDGGRSVKEDSPLDQSPAKDLTNGHKTINNNKELNLTDAKIDKDSTMDTCKLDKDSVMGDSEVLSDVESEGTQPEEDEDKNLSSEELSKKLEKLLRLSEQQQQQLTAGAHSLRATCYGQDRYWRRYWSLGKCGGIFVEAMESAQPEILSCQQNMECNQRQNKPEQDVAKRRKSKGRKGQKDKIPPSTPAEKEAEIEGQKSEAQIKSELELKNIKSELNLSDHTQIIKYEPNVQAGRFKLEGSPIKMEEKYIQHQQNKDAFDMLDIEDSIPTAFLVQKPSMKPLYAGQSEPLDKPQEVIKVENTAAKMETDKQEVNEIEKDVNNLEELRKMAEAMTKDEDTKEERKDVIKEEKKEPQIKDEKMSTNEAHAYLYTKILEGKWFSILRKENSLLTNTQAELDKYKEGYNTEIPIYLDNIHNCSDITICQGHKWDVSNNVHLLNDPSLFTLNSMVTCPQVPSNTIFPDSSLTMSGLDQDLIDGKIDAMDYEVAETFQKETEVNTSVSVEKDIQKAKNSLGMLNFNALSTYVTCDSPPPIQMSPEEVEQLESCKVNGLPKNIDGSFVPRELRHGWWRITDPDTLKELIQALHPRGVRERELHTAFLTHTTTVNNKLHIEKGDMLSTELSISHLDRVIAQNGGFPSPDPVTSYSAKVARRIDLAILELVEQLEDRVAAASLQIKGWRPSRGSPVSDSSGAELVSRARYKLATLETNIERRYLKPPLGQSSSDASLGAVLQAESHERQTQAQSPQQNSDASNDTKESKGVPRGLVTWRDAVSRCQTSAQIAMLLHALEAAIAWDKSIMKANCQFCRSGDNEDKLLLCDQCDKGYHTYCFKPKMDKIPEGDWYCWECVNKARGEKVCIVCGGSSSGRLLPCALCARAYHLQCHYPALNKTPRGKWYCSNCASKAPPKKPRHSGKRKDKTREQTPDQHMVPSPAPSHASTSTTADDSSSNVCPSQSTPEKTLPEPAEPENGLDHRPVPVPPPEIREEEEGPTPEKRRNVQYVGGNGTLDLPHDDSNSNDPVERQPEVETSPVVTPIPVKENSRLNSAKKDKSGAKRLLKELQQCKNLLDEMESHRDAWPFLLPVNTKQFPVYKKAIRTPMDLSTIKKKLNNSSYKCKEDFATDVRQIFTNCEVFNEDESPVGQAGHGMRSFFEERWNTL